MSLWGRSPSLSQNYENPTELNIYQNMTLKVGSDTRLYLSGGSKGCAGGTDQFGALNLSLNQGSWPVNPSCSVWMQFDKSEDDSICSDGAKTIQTLMTEKKPELPDGPKLQRHLYASDGSGTLSAAARTAIEVDGWVVSGNYLRKELSYSDVTSDAVVDALVASLPTSGSSTHVNSAGATGSDWSTICSPGGVQDTNCFSLSSSVDLGFSYDYGGGGVYCVPHPISWTGYWP